MMHRNTNNKQSTKQASGAEVRSALTARADGNGKKETRSPLFPLPPRSAELLALIAVTVCGIAARWMLFPLSSWDLERYLIPWYETIRDNGGFRAVGMDIGDYAPTYRYFLAFLTTFRIPAVAGIKVFSGIFELIGAVYIMRIAKLVSPDPARPMLAYTAAFCLPTVMLNSAAWGQCDGIYTCFLIISLYELLRERDARAMIMFGLAFSFKLQAIFFAPFVLVMILRGRIRIRSALLAPAVFVVSVLPAAAAGGSFFSLLTVYARQSAQYGTLDMALPNLWTLIKDGESMELGGAGVFGAGAAMLAYVWYGQRHTGKTDKTELICAALVSCMAVPFFLPYMHERYFFTAEVLLILAAVCRPERLWMPAAAQFCGIITVSGYLFDKPRPDMRLLTLIEAAVLCALCLMWSRSMKTAGTQEQTPKEVIP